MSQNPHPNSKSQVIILSLLHIIIVDHYKVAVVDKGTGEKISEHEINPSKIYWTNSLPEFNEKRRKSPI